MVLVRNSMHKKECKVVRKFIVNRQDPDFESDQVSKDPWIYSRK
jgi:hypothetical protein